jgi:RNA polymerase sigma-70 factor (ECF subfamily)
MPSAHDDGAPEPLPHFPGDRDAALVDRLRRREEGAAEALVMTYGDKVYRLAIRVTGNRADAEEVVQDVLWTATRKIDAFRGASAFGSWIYRITANAAIQKRRGLRHRRGEVPWEDVTPTFDELGQFTRPVLDWSASMADPAVQADVRSVLGVAVDELPPDHRVAFLLHDVEGLSNPEIALALDVTLEAVKSRVHRARLFLRDRLSHRLHTPA